MVTETTASEIVLLNSGKWLDLEQGRATAIFTPPDPRDRQRYIDEVLAKKRLDYEGEFRVANSDREDLAPRLREAQARLVRYQDRYDNYRSEWRIYIDPGQAYLYLLPFDGGPVEKAPRGSEREPYVRIGLDYTLLKMILDRKAYWPSGGMSPCFWSRSPDKAW